MISRLTSPIVLFCLASGLSAGTMTPYEVVLLAYDDEDANRLNIIKVDLDTGTQTVMPIEAVAPSITIDGIETGPSRFDPSAIATAPDGSIMAMDSSEGKFTFNIGRLDRVTGQWEIAQFPGSISRAGDLEVAPNGNLIATTNDGPVLEIDPKTGQSRGVLSQISDMGPFHVEVDSSGAIVADSWLNTQPRTAVLQRLAQGAPSPERIHFDFLLNDFAFDSDDRLLAVARDKVYAIDLSTGEATVVDQDDALKVVTRMAIDPAGRIVALNQLPNEDQLVRIDLATGQTETLELVTSLAADMDLLIIPEPSTFVLLAIGAVSALIVLKVRGRVRGKLRSAGLHGAEDRTVDVRHGAR